MGTILQVLQKETFIENVILLIITAIVADFLVPRVKARLDQDKFEREKRFEDDLARSAKLREDRIKLLDELESQLWEYQFLLLEPSYYVLRNNEAGFKRTFQQYDDKASPLLSTISARVSKLSRLAEPETHRRFQALLQTHLITLDSELIRLAETGDLTNPEWQKHHDEGYKQLGKEIEAALLLLAQDFGLTKEQTSPRQTKAKS
jgi:hypothetical protein